MSNTNTGGPAFPVQSVYIEDQETNSHGMTLRDYFAAKAMQSLVLMSTGEDNEIPDAAEAAYWYADAMLKARSI
jgi:hypothetical protein